MESCAITTCNFFYKTSATNVLLQSKSATRTPITLLADTLLSFRDNFISLPWWKCLVAPQFLTKIFMRSKFEPSTEERGSNPIRLFPLEYRVTGTTLEEWPWCLAWNGGMKTICVNIKVDDVRHSDSETHWTLTNKWVKYPPLLGGREERRQSGVLI